jgi:small nuclear ribonucleoprotein (snRNP)-like protein
MKKTLTLLLFLYVFIIILTGCFSSTRIYKKEYEKNDSSFVQREVGAEVFIRMNNDEEYTGELLIVNDSTMLLNNDVGLTKEELFSSTSQINIIRNHNVRSMWILGGNNHLIGLAIGVGVGVALISIAKQQEDRGEKIVIGGLGLLSAITGLLLGAVSSTYDEELYNSKNKEDFDFIQLNIYSRYGGDEPEYLKAIK